jgi:hypothetical protein
VKGEQGHDGQRGKQGKEGPPGASGPKGAKGAPGYAGRTGLDGNVVSNGRFILYCSVAQEVGSYCFVVLHRKWGHIVL